MRAAQKSNDIIEEEGTPASALPTRRQFWLLDFIVSFGIVLVSYTALNVGLATRAWDPYPFILLNLFLSMLAAIQAPIIMMSQNRQDKKDRLRSELDFDVNRRAEQEIQGLAHKINLIGDKIGDVEDLVRQQFGGRTPTVS